MTSNAYASGGLTIGYAYNVAGDLTEIRENPAGSNFLLASYSYDDLGRRTLLTRGNGTTTSYTYDAVSRLSQLAHNIGGSSTTYDVTLEYTHNPAAQIASTIRNNDTYAWPGHYAVNRPYTADGLNRYSAAGSVTPTYDARGNMTSAGSATYIYTSDDRLARIQNVIGLYYDPLGRLGISSGVSNYYKFDYQGQSLVAEYDISNALLRRYVHGPGIDEPLVWYEGSGTSERRWFHADERGSIISVSNASGNAIIVNSYDEYGIPWTSNFGRFQYTGQQWIPETRHVPLQSPRLLADAGPLHADRSDRVRRRDEPLWLCAKRSGELYRPPGAMPTEGEYLERLQW